MKWLTSAEFGSFLRASRKLARASCGLFLSSRTIPKSRLAVESWGLTATALRRREKTWLLRTHADGFGMRSLNTYNRTAATRIYGCRSSMLKRMKYSM